MESKINRTVDIELGGEVRTLKYNIRAIEELEARLPDKNIFTLANSLPCSLTTTIDILWIGLKWQDFKLQRATVQGWVMDAMTDEENDLTVDVLTTTAIAALGLSGAWGKDVSVFRSLVTKEETQTEGK